MFKSSLYLMLLLLSYMCIKIKVIFYLKTGKHYSEEINVE